jgi:hypothetical protein
LLSDDFILQEKQIPNINLLLITTTLLGSTFFLVAGPATASASKLVGDSCYITEDYGTMGTRIQFYELTNVITITLMEVKIFRYVT